MTEAIKAPAPTAFRGVDPYSAESMARMKRRYRAEARFKFFGLAAVLVAGVFVLALLGDIIRKGMPAFFEHRALLEITLSAETIDPKGTRDPAELRAADYQRLVYDALRNQFPNVKERRLRRKLEGLVSAGAGDDLRVRVLADPSLIGKTIRMPVLLSDDADLHLKGKGTRIERADGGGALALNLDGGAVELRGASAFAAPLGALKGVLRSRADALSRDLSRIPPSRPGMDNTALDAQRMELTQRRDGLRKRADDAGSTEALDPTLLPSLVVEAGGGMFLLSEIGKDSARGTVLVAPSDGVTEVKAWRVATYVTPEADRRVTDAEIAWLEALRAKGQLQNAFATRFFTNGDSREPELAGIRGALTGSALTLLVTLLFCLPIGVGAAVYLEEFAPKNRLTDILEVNINNLAAVPSIVFGLLGLAMFLNFFGLPRSAPLVGGLVLALLVLPTIIIASRAALKAVPPSIKEAALGVGASHQQAIFHHVLPLAMPGIMTGTIIGMAHALGETAPLLMIGMVAFIVDVPAGVTDAATVLPVQIYLWSDLPEMAFQTRTAAAIMVLLGFLFVMNGAAILLRRRFERRW
ncbi:MAG: phosphate ABC transporter permease PstA [Proteobacteria bacterium]|nr:phosphate ABC transporter permease PstA [Pseudomonadota bacterium]